MQRTNDDVIWRKHVGSHRRELPTLRGRLRRRGHAQRKGGDVLMRQEGGKERKGDMQRTRGSGPTKRLNVRQRWRRSFWS